MLVSSIEKEYSHYVEWSNSDITLDEFKNYYKQQYDILKNRLCGYLLNYIRFTINYELNRQGKAQWEVVLEVSSYNTEFYTEMLNTYPNYPIATLVQKTEDCLKGYISKHGLLVDYENKETRGDAMVLHDGDAMYYEVIESDCYRVQLDNIYEYSNQPSLLEMSN